MADGEGTATDGAAKGKGGKLKLVVGVLLLVAGGYVASTMLFGGSEEAAAVEAAPEPSDGAILPVTQMVATLPGEPSHMARVSFSVVLDAMAEESAVTGRFALLENAAIDELARSDADTLTTPEGVDDLRSRLTAQAQEIYPDGAVRRVVLTELVVQ